MALFVLLAQMMIGQMGINLRRGDTGMAQQFLNVAQGGAILEQMGGEAMPQGVGGNPLVYIGLLAVGFQNAPNPLAG